MSSSKRKKLGTKKFYDAILSAKNEEMSIVQRELEATLDKHKLNSEQRDDITVIGIRL